MDVQSVKTFIESFILIDSGMGTGRQSKGFLLIPNKTDEKIGDIKNENI